MGLPARIVEEITDFGREAQASPSLTATTSLLSALDELTAHTRLLKERTDRLQRLLIDFIEAPNPDDLDEAIDLLRSAEQEMKRKLAPAVTDLKSSRKRLFSARETAPGERARAIATIDRQFAVLNEWLEMVRDFRWKMMTLRADLESPGDAPVFDDSEKLVEYLKAHSG